MATIVEDVQPHTHHDHYERVIERNRSDNGVGFLVAIVLILLVVFLIFYYGLPALKTTTGVNINVPKSINVNVNQPSQSGK